MQDNTVLCSITGEWPVVIDPDPDIPPATIIAVVVPSEPGTYRPLSGPREGEDLTIQAIAVLDGCWLDTLVVARPECGPSEVVTGQVPSDVDDRSSLLRDLSLVLVGSGDGDVLAFPRALRIDAARAVLVLARLARLEAAEALLQRLNADASRKIG